VPREASDRLGFLNYVAGSLASTLAVKLDAARSPLKELRDKEVTLAQRRNVRVGLRNQLGRLEHSQEKGLEKRIAELKEQIAKAEKDDEPIEKEHEILLRKALRESEQQKFQALREVGGLISARFKSSLSFVLSTVRSSAFSRRLPMPSLLSCHLSLHHRSAPTLAQRRQEPSVLLCSTHWITGNPAKLPSSFLRERTWIAPTRRASARRMLKN
jgi:hypothetical protein